MQTTVRDIAANSLSAVKVFEKLGIDYCCGGKRSLEDVCREKGLDSTSVQDQLDQAYKGAHVEDRDWATAPLTDLIRYIVETHHGFLRRELPSIEARLEKVYRVYNQRYGPALIGLPEVFAGLRAELELHMRKEETMLFPAIAAYESVANAGQALPAPPFGTVHNPIHVMEAEHESAGLALTRIREITKNFAVPTYACVTYRALMTGLEEFERDLHMHVHLENNILFPRAEQLEASHR